MRDLKKCKRNKEWMHIAQHRAKWRSIVDTVVTELGEEAEEMKKIRGRKEMRGSKYQNRPTYSVLNLVALLQPKTRQALSIILVNNNRKMEQQLKRSSFVVTAIKTLNNKVIEIIRSSAIKIRRVQRLCWGQ